MEIVAIVFGMPVAIVGLIKYFNYRTRKLEIEASGANQDEQKRIAELEGERHQLEERVQNLETIVTSVDLELNGRLNKLAAQQSQLLTAGSSMRALPAPEDGPNAQGEGEGEGSGEGADDSSDAAEGQASMRALQAPLGGLQSGAVLVRRFEIKRLLGAGGMGAVYLAEDRTLGEQVALKTIGANISEDPDAADRFRREVGAARKITHRNVIRIHDLGEDDGLLFISMEYFPGKTLAEVMAQRGQLPLAEALRLLDPICDAMAAAHDAGVVHRDLKPQNVLVGDDGEVRVIDFGLAKASYMRTMTVTGMIMGTPEYMAPEQVRGQAADRRADIYALAALAFHLLCGRPPFRADNPIAVGFQLCNDPPPSPKEFAPELPEYVERAILRGLAKEADGRFDRTEELKLALHGRDNPRQGPFA
jgi:hypothetical protein